MTDLHNRIFNYRNAKPDDKEDSRKLIDDLFAEVERLLDVEKQLRKDGAQALALARKGLDDTERAEKYWTAYEKLEKKCARLEEKYHAAAIACDGFRDSLVAEREWGDRIGHRSREANGNIVVCPATFGGRCDCILSERPTKVT